MAAVKRGDAKKVAELIRQNPGFDVNEVQDGNGFTLLHHACDESEIRSAVIPLLLAHPDIDINLNNKYGEPPFYLACKKSTFSVREMLKDSRVKVNEPDNDGYTPLFWAAYYGNLDVIKWWIASGREIDLGTPGDVDKTDALAGQRRKARQKWPPCWRDSRVMPPRPGMR